MSLRGITRFSEACTVDFDALGEGLVAVVGVNGSGKTTLLEAAPAALWKTFPTRPGSLYDYATGRDAFISAVFVDDAEHAIEVRVQIDAAKRSTEGYLLVDGAPITTGRAAEFQAQVERLFGSQALFLASVFACQTKKGSFLDATKGERKALFAELLGLGYLEALAVTARARETGADADLSAARAVLAQAEREAQGLDAALADLQQAQENADAAAGALDTARTEETAAQAAVARVAAAEGRLGALVASERSAREALAAADAAVTAATKGTERAKARRDERIRAVEARRAGDLEGAARKRHLETLTGIGRRRTALEAQLRDVLDVEVARARVQALENQRQGILETAQRISSLDLKIRDLGQDLRRIEADVALDRKSRQAVCEQLQRQASRLGEVPCVEGAPPEISGACPLLADAREAAERLAAGKNAESRVFAEEEARLEAVTAAYGAARREREPLGEVPSPASVDSSLPFARRILAQAEAAGHAREQLAALDVEKDDADAKLRADLEAAAAAVAQAQADYAAIEGDYADDVTAADAAVTEASQKWSAARDAFDAATKALEAARAEAGDVAGVKQRAADAVEARNRCERGLRIADQALSTAQARVDQLRAKAAAVEGLRAAAAGAETEVGDWGLLERSLGKDGVQALEVDAASPEVTGLVNDLLGSCYGPRFSVKLETLAEKRDGGFRETFDVQVYDGGDVRPVEALSGGEKVVVGEAVALAIAILNARKNRIRWRTLFRDETAGALDPANASAYVTMLRRARALGSFSHVVFVAHQEAVWESADVQVFVEDGKVRTSRRAVAA
jgi:exonuclease SbcC